MRTITPKLLSWASEVEPEALEQARRTSELPFVQPHVALMPDAHLGLGATVGSVIPTEGAVVPAAVGVDIGCGMIAVRTGFDLGTLRGRAARRGGLAPLREAIERAVPLSAGARNRRVLPSAAPRVAELEAMARRDYAAVVAHWPLQLGSLGSGNHFIEVTHDEAGAVWLFLHSGSRGIGNRLAQEHIAVARRLAERDRLDLPDRDLAHLAEGTPEFDAYLRDLRWAQHFALLNREEMVDRVVACLAEFADEEVEELERINCHHNFTQRERHFGRDLWVSRKGAIQADRGRWGLVPGSMGTASYVVRGLGDALSLESSPHGAGRRLSRTRARRSFGVADLRAAMAGIEHRDTAAFLDEHPLAYKDVDRVVADSADLVEVVHVLRQVVNVKGD